MFDSKKWLILFFVLALIGSIGGSLIAYAILQKKRKPVPVATSPNTSAKPEKVVPTESATAAETKPAESKPSAGATHTPAVVDESVKPDFAILTRAEWKAHEPVADMKPNTPVIVSLHHTATPPAPDRQLSVKMRNLQDFSQHEGNMSGNRPKPIWPDIPYHYYIDVKGDVAEGREVRFVGDTNTDYDSSGQILVALEGNFDKGHPTKEQMDTLFRMIKWLTNKYKIPADKITTHKAYVSTACPGKNLESQMDEIRRYAWRP